MNNIYLISKGGYGVPVAVDDEALEIIKQRLAANDPFVEINTEEEL